MRNVGQMILTIIMAEGYEFCRGKKIEIYKKDEFYYAASNGKDFGLVKEITKGTLNQMKNLPERFPALITESKPAERLLEVRVKLRRETGD